MSHWNYRVITSNCGNGEFTYGVHEVYYDASGKPTSWSEQPVQLLIDSSESWGVFFEKVQCAIKKPTLMQKYCLEASCWKLEEEEGEYVRIPLCRQQDDDC